MPRKMHNSLWYWLWHLPSRYFLLRNTTFTYRWKKLEKWQSVKSQDTIALIYIFYSILFSTSSSINLRCTWLLSLKACCIYVYRTVAWVCSLSLILFFFLSLALSFSMSLPLLLYRMKELLYITFLVKKLAQD